jgi:hypothetical protein
LKRALTLLAVAAAIATLSVACTKKKPQTAKVARPEADKTIAVQTKRPQPEVPGKAGNVIETMNSGGYTYVQVDTGKEKIWAAAPQFSVEIGDPVVVPPGLPMVNFHSNTLNRTFKLIYFVSAIGRQGAPASLQTGSKGQGPPQMPPGHPSAVAKATVDFSGIVKPKGGLTVSEVITGKKDLAGKAVVLRGKVVKFMPGIMGKNWLHVQDGTGGPGTNDLTVTVAPQTVAKVGDTVLVKGIVTTNKDFGYGYKYDVILQDAQVTVE